MRFLIAGTTASLMIAGAVLASAAPAYADDDAYFNHAKGTMSGAPAESSSAGAAASRPYMQEEKRDTQTQASSSDDALFNHAKGTMSGSEPATPAAGGTYVASYPHYMQMDPRDAKADPNASQDVDGQNPMFNHAKGTMSPN